MLILTYTKGARHGSIPLAAKALELMGKKTGAFEATISDDVGSLAAENLAKFDALCSDQCTGALSDDEAIKKSVLDFVAGGKGWVGIHAATDVGAWKFPEYHEMIGGVFAGHPFKKISVKLDDPTHPVNAAFGGKGFETSDEIYTFKAPYSRDKLRVLLSIDWENSGQLKGGNRADNDYALSWVKSHGKGRVFYCAFGHVDNIWFNPAILRHYLDGIQFALGDLSADTTPIAKLTPAPAPARGPVLAP
jgi:type 1 glutamine amidotransferase